MSAVPEDPSGGEAESYAGQATDEDVKEAEATCVSTWAHQHSAGARIKTRPERRIVKQVQEENHV